MVQLSSPGETPFISQPGPDYYSLGLLVVGIGTVATAINLAVIVQTLRTPGMKMSQLPLFVWMVFVNTFIILFAMPALMEF